MSKLASLPKIEIESVVTNKSIDTVVESDEAVNYPSAFWNSFHRTKRYVDLRGRSAPITVG